MVETPGHSARKDKLEMSNPTVTSVTPKRRRTERKKITEALWRKANRQRVYAANRAWAVLNPERARTTHNAAMMVYRAIRAGKLIRPDQCSGCRQHSTKIEAAHVDYARPLDVIWLCVRCHRDFDRVAPKTLGVRS